MAAFWQIETDVTAMTGQQQLTVQAIRISGLSAPTSVLSPVARHLSAGLHQNVSCETKETFLL